MTFMEQEARESPEAVQRFLKRNGPVLADLGRRLRAMEPPLILTSARGSSDNAAGYLKYLAEILLGTPCASVGASVASLYGARLRAHNALAVTISQSGQSPDIVALQDEAKRAGALSVAIVNVEDSPAARNADICLPLCAGPEKSVAATKTFIVSLTAAAALVAHWRDDPLLKNAVAALPDNLSDASHGRWPDFVDRLAEVDSLYVLGRGPSLPVASESALKLKETCAIHAEAYSAAEVMHGPLELVGEGFSVFVYAQQDQSLSSTQMAIQRLKAAGAKLLVAGAGDLPTASASHPLLEPIVMIQSTYLAVEELARRRGRDPDAPRMLRKVTETV
jgi:glucosamine--fructose-6-phosphate aminotransferase (isomerizing)